MRQKGYVLFEGKSQLDGQPIAVIATMKTSNIKTGDMVQTWILRQDIAPHLALKTGDDSSVCGDCIHRPANQGSCYVTVFQAPLRVYKSYRAGKYSKDTAEFHSIIKNRLVRFGAYGDPAAAPTRIWKKIADNCAGNTGYTHQYNHSNFDSKILAYVMASADTEDQSKKMARDKIRYFRTIRPGDKTLPREIECLSDSIGKSCADCLLCDGGKKGKSVYIEIHGAKASKFNPDLIAAA